MRVKCLKCAAPFDVRPGGPQPRCRKGGTHVIPFDNAPARSLAGLSATKIAGFCPMGCGETLFRAEGGYVTCSWYACPCPGAVDQILGGRESEHIVHIEDERFHVQHPLRERLNGELFECDLHRWLSALEGPPRKPGRYRVSNRAGHGWVFVEVSETDG